VEREKDNTLEHLINRLCALRGIELNVPRLKITDDLGKRVNLSATVGESGLHFIEISDKSTEKRRKMEKKKNAPEDKKFNERPSKVNITIGEFCYLPLEEQLYDDEMASIAAVRQLPLSQYFSDEYIVATLFARKFDLKRTEDFLKNSLAWRREKGFMKIPLFSELDQNMFNVSFQFPGSRDKVGRSIRYLRPRMISEYGLTIESITKWAVWVHYVGLFSDGIDSLRNGICNVVDLDGYGWKNFDIERQRQISQLWTERFPLLVRKILVVNPPTIFAAIYKILHTFTKVKILSRLEVTAVKDIGNVIDADNLATELGGNAPYNYDVWKAKLIEWTEKNEARLVAPGRNEQ